MRWRFWAEAKMPNVPNEIRAIIANDFNLDSGRLEKLRYAEKNGRFSTRKVKLLRIFDPDLVGNGPKHINSYDDLDNFPQAVLFEGHADKLGYIFLTDKRPGNKAKPASLISSPG